MAREPQKSHKSKHKHRHKDKGESKDSHAHSKSSKGSKLTTSHHAKSIKPVESLKPAKPAKEPLREPEIAQKLAKHKKIVSVAGIFKHSKKGERKHRHRRERTPTPEPTLADIYREDIQEAIIEARDGIDEKLSNDFTTQYDNFKSQLCSGRKADISFLNSISATAGMVSAPIGQEQIETTFTRDGERVTEIVEIGKRVELFKKSVEKDESNLKGYWEAWDQLQGEIVDLGAEVFGADAFGGDVPEKDKGYKVDMKELNAEFDLKVQELTEEIESLTERFLAKMKKSEMEFDEAVREQQRKLINALM